MPDAPSHSLTGLGAITIFVRDLAAARRFYADALGLRQLYADDVSTGFDFGNTIINLLQEDEAPGLIGPAKVAAAENGARAQLTIFVEDANAAVALLQSRGVTVINGPIDRPWGKRTACFTDPDGTVWEIAQDL